MSKETEKLYNGITNIDDDMIESAQDKAPKKKPVHFGAWAAAAAVLVCAAGGVTAAVLMNGSGVQTSGGGNAVTAAAEQNNASSPPQSPLAYLIAQPTYPEIPHYPEENFTASSTQEDYDRFDKEFEAWSDARRALRVQPKGYTDGTEKFFSQSIKTLLSGSGSENRVYSPASLFMALGMTAEISGSSTRRQILDLLGQDSIESLRSHANSIWQANYMDDGIAKCVLANSIWLRNGMGYSQDAINHLSIDYYASSYSGQPGAPEYDALLRDWISRQTDGMLDNYAEDIKLDPETVIGLVSTVDFAGKWNSKFSADETESGIFHAPSGDITCEFMNKDMDMNYFWGDKFASVTLSFENNGAMKLILPDEGVTPEELLNDSEAMDYILSKSYSWENRKYTEVILSVPKFDVSSDIDLTDSLNELGITELFDAATADFSPLTGDSGKGNAVSQAKQAARVMIDEEGCRASALTIMATAGAAMPDGKAELILDRPFIFVITCTDLPLFVGVVNDPGQ